MEEITKGITDAKMKISEQVAKIYTLMLLGMFLVSAVGDTGKFGLFLMFSVFTGMFLATLYGAVGMDMGLDIEHTFKYIKLAISLIVAVVVTVVALYSGVFSELVPLERFLGLVGAFGIVAFIVHYGSSILLSAAWSQADIHRFNL